MINQKRNDEKFNNKDKDRTYVVDEINEEFNDFNFINANDYDDHEKNYYIDENKTHDQDDYNFNMILYISENQL